MLESSETFLLGELCTYILGNPSGGYAYLPARVMWTTPSRPGRFLSGVAFGSLTPVQQQLLDLILGEGVL